ncbi:hypothetical protein J5837_04105 [Pseudoxanthomonas helianthi]|uniref:Uncharacterized protein n=1 Tax=Pseudoxanthomonas helianthi TaxID=1453541 RepID=A0A940X1L7_9GAMM|nr:hypothetical protein [Pseudoxanthomonas helianthi]MBP3983601.1 hypothetical protein [Pseudoxanthomonas helianthi]
MKDLRELGVQELLDLRAEIEKELASRGLSSAVGDIGERLAIEYFAKRPDLPVLVPAPRGTKNIDALSRRGERYSIKTLQRARKTGTIYPDPEENCHPMFEYMLIVLLSNRYELQKLYRLSWDQFVQLRSWDRRMHAWYVARSGRVLDAAEDLTPLHLSCSDSIV